MQTKGQFLAGIILLVAIMAGRGQTNLVSTNYPGAFTLCSNSTGFVWVPNSVVASINLNSNRIYVLKAKSEAEEKKLKEDVRLIWARQAAGEITATAASAQERALTRQMLDRLRPAEKEIPQRRLSNLRLRRAYKLDDNPNW